MSRHRNVRKINYEDELDDDYGDDDYDYDEEEEEGTGASGSGAYTYDRNALSANYYTYLTDSGRNSPSNLPKIEETTVEDTKPAAASAAPAPSHHAAPSSSSSSSMVRNLTAPLLNKPKGNANGSTPSTPKRTVKNANLVAVESASKPPTRNNSEVDLTTFRRNQLQSIANASTPARKTQKQREQTKDMINLIVVGHVDAGKSTLMGHLLHDLGYIDNRTIDKYKHESARSGKASFAYAWVLDETEEERERGVTMDVGRSGFDTKTKRVTLLDAPGHKDFISNMITGTSQADAAILVVNATRGEFETGFENGGQTKEHALLLRSLGVTQIVVAVNKLDTVEWSKDRFDEIQMNLKVFLTKQAGFSSPRFIPVSGSTGDNLTKRLENSWYNGPCLLEMIDSFVAPCLPADGPLRMVVSDVLKTTASQLVVSGKIESGEIEKDDKLFIMPSMAAASVKACSNNDAGIEQCLAGDYVLVTLNGTFEPDSVHSGSVIVRGGSDTLIPAKRFSVRLVVFEILTPIMKGAKAELYAHSVCVPCTFIKLIHTINKSNGEVLKNRPRFLARGTSALVEIEAEHEIAIEPFTSCRALGRVTFRSGGQTIAAGIIETVTTL